MELSGPNIAYSIYESRTLLSKSLIQPARMYFSPAQSFAERSRLTAINACERDMRYQIVSYERIIRQLGRENLHLRRLASYLQKMNVEDPLSAQIELYKVQLGADQLSLRNYDLEQENKRLKEQVGELLLQITSLREQRDAVASSARAVRDVTERDLFAERLSEAAGASTAPIRPQKPIQRSK